MAKAKVRLPVESVATNQPERILAKRSAEEEARERKWKAEDALRTMKEYEKIKTDKVLMSDAKKLAKDEMRKLKKIC